MNWIELAAIGLTIGLIVLSWVPDQREQRAMWILIVLADGVFLALALAGLRWQMIPLLIALVSIQAVWLLYLAPIEIDLPAVILVAGSVFGLLLVGLSAFLAVALPVPNFAAVSDYAGPYPVGTTTFDWVDEGRAEQYGPNPGSPREIMIQVWYPADPPPSAQPALWTGRPDDLLPALAEWVDLPPFMLGHLRYGVTNSYPGAPPADEAGQYPVIVYSHGWGGVRIINQDQLEMLASNGYIVVAPDHTYGAVLTVFDDGRLVPYAPDALPDEDAPNYNEATRQLRGTYAADISFILDQLARINAGQIDSALAGRLDLERVGVFGHSTGGGGALVACSADERCDAVLTQDGWVNLLTEEDIPPGDDTPMLILNSELWSGEENSARQVEILDAAGGDAYFAEIEGTSHYDFTLLPLLSPLAPQLGLKGPLPAAEVLDANHKYLLIFFDAYLRDGSLDDLRAITQ